MPQIIDNHSAHRELNKIKNDPVTKYKELIPTIQEFAKNANHLFYFQLEECRVGSSTEGNIEVCYQGTDIDGKDRTFYIEILEGSLRLRGLKSMCGGVDMRTGKALPITVDDAYVQFRSAVNLFLTDVGAWSEKHNVPVDYIIFPPKPSKIAFKVEKPSKYTEDEVALWFQYTGDYSLGD